MKEAEFRKKINRILPLVLTHATDFYGVKHRKDLALILEKIGQKNFTDKCNEGFKIGQTIILDSLVSIEREILLLTPQLKEARVARNENRVGEIIPLIKNLSLQKAVFQELANVIVWTIFKMERTEIKAFMQPGMNNKSLLESNLKSLIETADFYNKQSDKFALISDITSCVGMGDLLVVDTEKNTWSIVEVKEGAINEMILEVLSKGNFSQIQKYLNSLTDIKDATNLKKQFDRVVNQHKKATGALEYNKVGAGTDLFTGRTKKLINLTAIGEKYYSQYIFKAVRKLYSKTAKADEIYFPFDCGVVGVIKNPSSSKKWDFQHFIYHTVMNPNGRCAYTDFTEEDISVFKHPEVRQHFNELRAIPLYEVKDKVYCITHQPIFFHIPKEHAPDLFTEKLAIYVYFYLDEFIDMCNEAGLNPSLENFENSMRGETKHIRNSVVKFGEKCLVYGTENKRFEFSNGLFFRIIFEFQTAESVIKQMVGLVEGIVKKADN